MTTTAQRRTRPARPGRRRATGVVDSPVLDRAVDDVAARASAELCLLSAAIEWAETHPVPADERGSYTRWWSGHEEGVIPLAGEGSPLVSEFAPDELAVALGWSVTATQSWMSHGLELKYRLPDLFDLTMRGVVPLHLARYVADHTRDLSLVAAGYADRLLCRDVARLTRARVRMWVGEARLYHEPECVVEDERQALASRKVELTPGNTPATTDVVMRLDTLDALAFDRTLSRTAAALKALRDTDDLEVRRARAVGVLADPQKALDLLVAGRDPGRDPGRYAAGAVLWLHLDESALHDIDTFPAPIRSERLGALSSDLVRMWLTDTTVTIKPVLDLDRSQAVDRHDPPEAMADQVRLRDPACVFPGCQRSSRACDLDHIVEYVPLDEGGPPGQTFPSGLAPLCRRHHRVKTHTRWSYRRRRDGGYRWTTPAGRSYDVDRPP